METKLDPFKEKYLEKKIVILKPVPREGKMVGLDRPQHVNFFMANGATEGFVVMLDKKGDRIPIFKDDDEKAFFEKEIGKELNVNDDEGYLAHFRVKVTKDDYLMEYGAEFDLSKAKDNLRYRVLKTNNTIAPSWDERYENTYKWALVDKEDENKKEVEQFSKEAKAYMAAGELQGSEEKVRRFLQVYFADNSLNNVVSKERDKDWLIAQMHKLIKNDPEKFLYSYNHDLYDSKVLIFRSIEIGGIEKSNAGEYKIVGEEGTLTFKGLAELLKEYAEDQHDIYMKLVSLISAV